MYIIKDSMGKRVSHPYFHNVNEAIEFKNIFGNKGWYIINTL